MVYYYVTGFSRIEIYFLVYHIIYEKNADKIPDDVGVQSACFTVWDTKYVPVSADVFISDFTKGSEDILDRFEGIKALSDFENGL